MKPLIIAFATLAGTVASLVSCAGKAADQPVDFGKQIAPIIAQHCVRCHCPDNRKGDLSLATFADLQANEYVISGDPDRSYLMELVTSKNGESPAMPQMATPLSADEVGLLRQWIDQGASWPRDVVVKEKSKADGSWWSLQPLWYETPKSKNPAASVDAFIRAKLDEHGLTLSPQADRRTLIRRLTFDLHGLPPTPEASKRFVDDPDPQAYEKLVDHLLDSPQYGERLAQHWLDIAHYADTHGFERDMRRDHAWRYRDYVIQSLNDDKPYHRFLQEQIAGDVLWPDDPQAIIATGFLAAGPWDFVGQVETKSPALRRAARTLDLDDMATQVMATTMGLTINCARCHDHKLDPISQQEYYQLQAVFAGVRRDERVVSATILQQYEASKELLLRQQSEVGFQIARVQNRGLDLADIIGGGNGLGSGTYRQAIDPRDAKVQIRDFGKLGNVVTNRFSKSAFPFIDGVFIPDGEDGIAEIPVSSTGITVRGLPKTSGNAWDMIRNGPVSQQHSSELDGIDFTGQGHRLLGLHANAGVTFDVTAIRNALCGQNANRYDALRFTAKLGYFGATGGHHADAWVYVDGNQVAYFPRLRREDGLQDVAIELPRSARFLTLITTDGGNGFSMDQIGFGDPTLSLATPVELSSDDRGRLDELHEQRQAIAMQLEALGPEPKFYGIVAEPAVPEVRLLTRGDPETPTGDPIDPAALQALAMLNPNLGDAASTEGDRRAALAHWITDPQNPLTHRVIANRLWHWHFGKGIVDTPSDFGFGGGRPSHAELLDWLAGELVRHDGSLKALHRLIVTSQTYRQMSYVEDAAKAQSAERIDADNRLLWRQNPRRLEAESIRDAVLVVSGKLNPQRGGPGFEDFDYQEAYAPIYTYVTADEPSLWRRSIYRYIVRATPNRFLTTLDCPDPANLTPSRMVTTTPLQSLALYNNDFMLRQSRYFAQRLEQEAGNNATINTKISLAFELAFGRLPTKEEVILASNFVEQQGLFAFCRSLLNSNEFVYVD